MDMTKKYFLTDETKQLLGRTLHRIQAVRTFSVIQEGQKGGWVEKESNLSHNGDCWVFDDAMVLGDAVVKDNARVYDDSYITGFAEVSGYSQVMGRSTIDGDVCIGGQAYVKDSEICKDAIIAGYANVLHSYVTGHGRVYGSAIIRCASIRGNSTVGGGAAIVGPVSVIDAQISKNTDFIIFKNWWSSGRYFVWTRSNDMWSVGCFHGTGEELIKKAYQDSQLSGDEYKRVVDYVESIKHKINTL